MDNIPTNEEPALANRKDLKAINYKKSSIANVQIAKSGYYHYFNSWRYTALD
jgi:hypothetical protein